MSEQPQPRPAAPRRPSPADLAARRAAVRPVVPKAPPVDDHSASMAFGRVGEDGTVYVRTDDGERAVGAFPGVSDSEALAYFARKHDELVAAAQIVALRVSQPDVSAHDARDALKALREQIGEANVVGDLAALEARTAEMEAVISAKGRAEAEQRAAGKAQATTEREALVAEAEALAARDAASVQWKQASARMRELLDEWQGMQKRGPRLDKDVESALWQRLRTARTTFDKHRKVFFSQLEDQHAEAKHTKERLVAEAERLATSKDWGPSATAFKELMQKWRQAGRAQRSDDDVLWERFKGAQDRFFAAKDQVVAAENAAFEANLRAKEALLVEAEALLPVDAANVESVKASLRHLQDRWDAVGKVPREAMARVEARMRKVEQAVRDVDDQRWKRANPELRARAQSMVEQLERAVQGLEHDLAAAQTTGDERRVAEAEQALTLRRQLLDSARAGLAEHGG